MMLGKGGQMDVKNVSVDIRQEVLLQAARQRAGTIQRLLHELPERHSLAVSDSELVGDMSKGYRIEYSIQQIPEGASPPPGRAWTVYTRPE